MTGQVIKRGVKGLGGEEPVVFTLPLRRPAAVAPGSAARPAASPGSSASPGVAPDEARTELERLRGELDALKRRAFEDGHREGLQAGLKAAETKAAESMAGALEALRRLALALDAAASEMKQRESCRIAEVTLCAVRRLLGEAWATPAGAAAAVQAVLAEAGLDGPVTVQLHAADWARWQAAGAAAEPVPVLHDVQFAAHPEVALGGCRVATPDGLLDARLETQLALLRQALEAARSAATGLPA